MGRGGRSGTTDRAFTEASLERGHRGIPETGPRTGVPPRERCQGQSGTRRWEQPEGSRQELARPQALEMRREVEVQRRELRLSRWVRRCREYEGLDMGSTPARKTIRELQVVSPFPTHFIPRRRVCLGLGTEAVKHRCPLETWEGSEPSASNC